MIHRGINNLGIYDMSRQSESHEMEFQLNGIPMNENFLFDIPCLTTHSVQKESIIWNPYHMGHIEYSI